MRKRVIILGSTGSIGVSALKVATDIPERMEVVGLAANRQADVLAQQAQTWKPKAVALFDTTQVDSLKKNLPAGTPCFEGQDGLVRLVREVEAEMVLVAIVGTSGLAPALAALESGKDLAVASKEILVLAGGVVMETAKRLGRAILPVDSEHNAVFQCLQGSQGRHVRRVILTASGGPFRTWTSEQIQHVKLEQALKHPTWKMGQKITIDSATMFNKGLEMIEAHWLFDVSMAQVDVVVHPQSIVHSLVEFQDGSQLAQLSHSDMCFPIQYAVTYPDRLPNTLKSLNLGQVGQLTFEPPDEVRFPALRLAREAGTIGGTLPGVFNAANEVAVEAFVGGALTFPGIWETVERVMGLHTTVAKPALSEIIEADTWARQTASKVIHQR
jgi:1-deoxy-D-xylulose-5-phosphate reductoisomerase